MKKRTKYILVLPTSLIESQRVADEFQKRFWEAFGNEAECPFKFEVNEEPSLEKEVIVLCKKKGLLDDSNVTMGWRIAEVFYDTCSALRKPPCKCLMATQFH